MGRPIDEIFRAFHEETCEPLENPLAVAIRRTRPIKSRAADAADPPRRQRALHREHARRRSATARARCPAACSCSTTSARSRELNRRLSYHASHDMLTGPRQPARVREPPRARAEERQGARDVVRAVLPRPRPVQDHQRHLRPQRRRRAAGPGRRAAEVEGPLARHARAPRRRRVRRAARELLARGGAAHRRSRCARRSAISGSSGKTARSGSARQHRRRADHGRQRGRGVAAVGRGQRLRRGQGSGPQPRAQLRRKTTST